MPTYKVAFDSLEWQASTPGARFKVFSDRSKQVRLLEFSSEFVELQYCLKAHIGIVLEGELEIDFDGKIICYGKGDGVFIPKGEVAQHKARSLTPSVQLFVVEEA